MWTKEAGGRWPRGWLWCGVRGSPAVVSVCTTGATRSGESRKSPAASARPADRGWRLMAVAMPRASGTGRPPSVTLLPDVATPNWATSLTRRPRRPRSEEHTSELQSLAYLVCRLLLEKKKRMTKEVGAHETGAPRLH